MDKLKLIVDTDIGSDIDDALCMAYLFEEDICAFKRGTVRIGIGDDWGRSYFTEDARGKDGAIYADANGEVFQPAFPVKAVDTTAAGDTFTGYFLAGLVENLPVERVLRMSAKAAAISVSREGAVPSIPYRNEVEEALQQ